VVVITWMIVAALATIAGVLYGLDKSFKPFTYFQLLLPIFASAIVGGLGNPLGAIARRLPHRVFRGGVTYAWKKVADLSRCPASSPRAAAAPVHRLQVRGLLHHPGDRAAVPAHRHLEGESGMSAVRPRDRATGPRRVPTCARLLLFALVAALFIGTGFVQSWNVALADPQHGAVSAIMALGVNMQWGYAGLFNVGVMGFVALGGLAAVLVSMPPVPEAWAAGGPGAAGARAGRRDHRRRDPRLDRACRRDGCGRWRCWRS
jgi:hypothetical protein